MKPTHFMTASLVILSAFSAAKAQLPQVDPLSQQVKNLLLETNKQGLVSGKYSAGEAKLDSLIQAGRADEARKQMVDLVTKISSDLMSGQVKAEQLNNRSIVTPKKLQKDQLEAINQFTNNTLSAEELVRKMQPTNSHYKKLVEALGRYQEAIRLNKVLTAPANLATIKNGVTDKNSILYARFRLNLLGYTNDVSNESLTDDLKTAIVQFQENQLLDADGIMGPGTWKMLNQDIAGQVSQIRINIDRARWLPNDMGANHVFVNLAIQKLKLYLNSELSMEFKTINGRLDRPTPILFDQISYALLNPTWTVPQNILLQDKVPMFTANPQKVLDLHIKVINDADGKEVDPFSIDWTQVTEDHIPYTLVQQPGKWNALGFIKFPLTNPYAIYLHDTDSRALFANKTRLLSSGCVRLEKPFEFAEKVLNSTQWTADKLRDQSERLSPEATSSSRVKMGRNIPVYLFYLTASVNDNGQVVLAPDSYNIDQITYNVLSKK